MTETDSNPNASASVVRNLVAPELLRYLPHREPFLLVDRIIEMDMKMAVGEKTFDANWDIYRGHFPARPVTPGAILLEAAAQTSVVLLNHIRALKAGKMRPDGADCSAPVYAVSCEKVRFRAPVLPGETVTLHCTVFSLRSWTMFVDFAVKNAEGKTCAEGRSGAAWTDV